MTRKVDVIAAECKQAPSEEEQQLKLEEKENEKFTVAKRCNNQEKECMQLEDDIRALEKQLDDLKKKRETAKSGITKIAPENR